LEGAVIVKGTRDVHGRPEEGGTRERLVVGLRVREKSEFDGDFWVQNRAKRFMEAKLEREESRQKEGESYKRSSWMSAHKRWLSSGGERAGGGGRKGKRGRLGGGVVFVVVCISRTMTTKRVRGGQAGKEGRTASWGGEHGLLDEGLCLRS